ncbi:hypothetical protein EYF80_034922 [Liparis tanakae]|uniref:Uncharacterized protein n=1 Tax=Liparis tanakae TaxID=230148 RepID=A0A4Z2GQA4_9TELE|nr:hypothetical protein EYF80_034922 [Liparis tanakae]
MSPQRLHPHRATSRRAKDVAVLTGRWGCGRSGDSGLFKAPTGTDRLAVWMSGRMQTQQRAETGRSNHDFPRKTARSGHGDSIVLDWIFSIGYVRDTDGGRHQIFTEVQLPDD